MDIEDLLNTQKGKEFSKYLTDEMYRTAGGTLVKKMTRVIGSETYAKSWYYTGLIALNGQRPYDFCKSGRNSEIEDLLGRIEHSVLS